MTRTNRAKAGRRRRRGELPEPGQGATRGDTGADVVLPAHEARTGGRSPRIGQRLREIATLHARMARAHEDLAEELETVLADARDLSVTPTPVPQPTTTVPAKSDAMLNQKELAALLRWDVRSVRRKERAGELPAPVGRGRLRRWRRSVIERWLDGDPTVPMSGRRTR